MARQAARKPIPDLLVFDSETGGLDDTKHDMIEMAAVRLDPRTLEEKGYMEARVFPLLPVSAEAQEKNGYDPEAWKATAIECGRAIELLNPLLDGAMLVGSNPSFDWGFLRAGAAAHGVPLAKPASHRKVPTEGLAWPLMVAGEIEGIGLDDICKYFGIGGEAHRAMSDVQRTIQAYIRLMGLWLPAADRYADLRAGVRADMDVIGLPSHPVAP